MKDDKKQHSRLWCLYFAVSMTAAEVLKEVGKALYVVGLLSLMAKAITTSALGATVNPHIAVTLTLIGYVSAAIGKYVEARQAQK